MPIERKTPTVEIIAEYLDCDIDEIREAVYQPTIYRSPRVFSWNDSPWSYLCCPAARQKPPTGFPWKIAGYSWRDKNMARPVYGATLEDINREASHDGR